MTRVQELAEEIKSLSPEEFAAFQKWFKAYDASDWDRQIEEDCLAGKFDKLAEKALSEHKSGNTSEI
jgi:hypothetical protein